MNLLPQAYCVEELIETAQKALRVLPDGFEKFNLEAAIKGFENTTALTTWHIDDVTAQRPDLTEDEARLVLVKMYHDHGCSESDWLFLQHCCDEIKPNPEEL